MVESLKNEIWLPVKDYEDYYAVSNFGRIKAFSREWFSGSKNSTFRNKKEILIIQIFDKYGYPTAVLTKNGKQKHYKTHRIVATTFLDNPNNLPIINHKNGIKSDNRPDNLEWCTWKYNVIHAIETGLFIPQKRGQHSQAKRVKCTTLDIEFDCIRDAADALGIKAKKLYAIISSGLNYIDGLTFRYI